MVRSPILTLKNETIYPQHASPQRGVKVLVEGASGHAVQQTGAQWVSQSGLVIRVEYCTLSRVTIVEQQCSRFCWDSQWVR